MSVQRWAGRARRRAVPILVPVGLLTGAIVAVEGIGIVPASAASVLCSGFSACTTSPYTDYGWSSHYTNSYWREDSGHNCTNYVAYYEQVVNGMPPSRPSWMPAGEGDADYWWGEASSAGIAESQAPVVGAVAWWGNYGWNGNAGHVAIVESVSSGGNSIDVSWDSYPSGPYEWVSLNSTDSNASNVGWPNGFIYLGGVGAAPSITTTSIPSDMVGDPYTASLGASGGAAPYHWSVAGGSLPPGLTLNAGGTISGTPASNGSYSFTVTVTGANNASSSETLAMNVYPGGNLLANGSFTFPPSPWQVIPVGSGVVNMTSFHHLDGVWPQQGSWFGASNTSAPGGVFYQDVPAPAQPGQTYTFSIWLRTLNGKPGTGTAAIFAEGGTLEHDQTRFKVGRTWTLVSVPLDVYQPGHTGLRVAVYENTTGVSYLFDGATLASDTGTYSILPAFTADTPPAKARLHHVYRYSFQASGEPAPAFSVSSGNLPPGLHLNSLTGVLSGVPRTSGTFHFTVSASNGIKPSATTRQLTIVVRRQAITATA
jgi:surface antigen